MPVYSYRCKGCGHEFSATIPMSQVDEPEDEPCFKCSKMQVKQVIGAPIIGYNSTGWMKPTDAFQDRMKEMKTKHAKSSTIDRGIR